MISISNESAAAEARRLSRELVETAIGAFAGLPAGVELRRLLAEINIDLREARADSGSFHWNQPHETVEISFAPSETAGTEHAAAIRDLTRIRTAELGDERNTDAVAQVRKMLRNDLAAEHDRLSRPLRLGRLLRGAETRRQAQRDALMQRALDTLCDVPLSGPLFDEVLASVCKVAGSSSAARADTESLKRQAMSLHHDFHTRRETILMLAWEAINSENAGADVELDLAGRRGRFVRSKAEMRATEEKKQAERILTAEKKRNEEMRRKRTQIVRDQEERRRWNEMTRPKWSPDENGPNKEPGLGG